METEILGIMLGVVLPLYPMLFAIWQKIGRYDEMHDTDGRRVYPRSPGIHTVQIRTGRRKFAQIGRVRDFSPEHGGYTSPVFEFRIAEDEDV